MDPVLCPVSPPPPLGRPPPCPQVEGDLEDCQAARSALGKAQDAMREAVASSIGHIRQLFPQLEMEAGLFFWNLT